MYLPLPGFSLLPNLISAFLGSVSSWDRPNTREIACLDLKSSIHIENTTITNVSYLPAGSSVSTPEITLRVSTTLCRVEFSTQTSPTSYIRAEAWLPDEWYGRFLGLGNGGLGGYIDYRGLDYGSSLHFASVGSNNGHGWIYRLPISTQPRVGKQIVKAYYTHAHTKSYYLGCSTGGRQGTQSALKYPADFDGILAGAPATDFNHLQYWTGITAKHLGSPTPESSPSYIPLDTWHDLIAEVVLKTCDLLDGVEDGTITEPDDCKFDPQVLLCGKYSTSCLTQAQVDALHKIYSPVYVDGKLIYPRFDPGAENDTASASLLSGAFPDFPKNWLRYAVLNDTHFDGSEFNETHLRAMDQVNPGGISTFDGDFSVFRARGGKFLTYHGRMDSLIASGNSKRYHDLVAQDFDTPDDFYRLFLVPGMGHCAGGPGATKFGQLGRETTAAKNDSQHNILLLSILSSQSAHEKACLSLKTLDLENTTITRLSYVHKGSSVATSGPCTSKADVTASLCRVEFTTNTSNTSSVRAEAWLPDEWYGRFLAIGNGGLGGCIDYAELDYGSSMHFATVGSNNGHDGRNGIVFLNNPEVINDFAFRSVHVEAMIGKLLVEAYYQQTHTTSYYLGCSTGGRQGMQAALRYPDDFDGIIAGAPATDWNHLLYWAGATAQAIGAPTPWSSPSYIPPRKWRSLIAKEILRQCDALDGIADGIISEPDDCDFDPQVLLCSHSAGANLERCLTEPQVAALRKIYSPLKVNGERVYPRFDPGAESTPLGLTVFTGVFPPTPKDWLRYAVLNDSKFDGRDFGEGHLLLMDEINPGGISTFDGNLSCFRDRGSKLLTYHGRMDPIIPSGNSKRYHNLITHTIGSPDNFYRLFLVPGMSHCARGPGAANFGQLGGAVGPRNDSEHNILLALVDWVEGGVAPNSIVGTSAERNRGRTAETRVHCMHPARSIWDGSKFICQN
ncbi:Carboxylic ester hydrolase [Mycena indigotica]|uniref:Carboxylic ester hydrolase n=1 Tax=Mycena indigotica TaxID=2126181 RepID=A0A8H6VTU0_9AGAR|nr:Carboxylic ester hydrolase [Mycena indigotica]KAF7289863.1 Carboxylic ester hydrolase [Mycena indigotica]